jgi:hypothetical protein
VLVTPQIIRADAKEVQSAVKQYDDLKLKSDEAVKFKLKD